tara:strand:- start:78 stop:1061 length:984 start_codon:yes stop_codon:yes gene_type:complete
MRELVLNNLQTKKGIIKSYSPTINKDLISLKSITPQKNVYSRCPDKKILINGKTCVGWNSKKAKDALIENLISTRNIDFKKVVAPKQQKSNCWFNVFFMVFFISDKGRQFFRHLREMMITGITSVNKKPIKKGLRWPFFQLNRAIDASLRGDVFAKEMDTNKIIASINRQIKTTTKVGKPGNPLDFYISIIEYLNNNPFRIENPGGLRQHIKWSKNKPPHLIIYEYYDNDSISRSVNKTILHSSGHTYRLENVILRDTSKSHFACFLTCNKKEWAFDGFSFSRMKEWKWKQKLNKNIVFTFNDYTISKKMEFNFKQGYQMLFYYRIN